MKEITITIRTYNRERHAEEEHPVTAYADDRFPGLAIHGPWELGNDDWRVTHVPSGLAIALLPTRAAATAALPLIGKLQNWNRPQEEVAGYGDKGMTRWLRVNLAAIVEHVKQRPGRRPDGRRRKRHDQGRRLRGRPGGLPLRQDAPGMAQPVPRDPWRLDRSRPASCWGTMPALTMLGKLAAALYAAASDFSPGGNFRRSGVDAAHLETAFRPPADLPGGVAREGPFARAV